MADLHKLIEPESIIDSLFNHNDRKGPYPPTSGKRKNTTTTNIVARKRCKVSLHGRPAIVSASYRVGEFPEEMLSCSEDKLYCKACKIELKLKKSIVQHHVASRKHICAKNRLKETEPQEPDIEEEALPKGYEYEFVDQVPEEYFCKLCKHVAREPHVTTCCGECFCKACVQDKKPCPNCEDLNITSFPQVKYQRNILALEVCCTMKDHGCEWTGQLQHLDAHLDVTTGDCQYVDVECPNKCDQEVQKCNVDTHLVNECPNRDYRCPHCNFKNKFHVVSDHFEVCPYYPLACPNRCGATFERADFQDHMKMCPLEEVQCVFSTTGCPANFIRENEEKYMDQNTQKHIAMMQSAILRTSQDFEQKLQEQQAVFEKKLEQRDKQIEQKLQEQQGVFENKLQEFEARSAKQQTERDAKIKALEEFIEAKDPMINYVTSIQYK